VLRPSPELVAKVLSDVDGEWPAYRVAYRKLLEARFAEDPAPFVELAERARRGDVHLGCNCPTARQPDVNRCHTVLALAFMKDQFPDLDVRFPLDDVSAVGRRVF
jgi:hypothetical protein